MKFVIILCLFRTGDLGKTRPNIILKKANLRAGLQQQQKKQ